MFRPVLRASLRLGLVSAGRKYATVRPARGLPKVKMVALAGFAIVASSVFVAPTAFVSNYTNEDKLEKDQKAVQSSAEPEKTARELSENAEESPQSLKASESSEPNTEDSLKVEGTNTDEEVGSQGAAYNPETGEINWDCPCLGGMAHGPCGEEFKAAFGCFVYSETEPKGIDCIEKFQAMRTCFREHPEHYKEELADDDEPVSQTEAREASEARGDTKNSTRTDFTGHFEKAKPAGQPKPAAQWNFPSRAVHHNHGTLVFPVRRFGNPRYGHERNTLL